MNRQRPWWRWPLEYLILMAGFGPVLLAIRAAPALPADWVWWTLVGWLAYMAVSKRVDWPSRDFWKEITKWAE